MIRIIRQCALWYAPSWHAATIACLKCGLPADYIPRVREIIRHEKLKTI